MKKNILFILFFVLFLTGCNNNSVQETKDNELKQNTEIETETKEQEIETLEFPEDFYIVESDGMSYELPPNAYLISEESATKTYAIGNNILMSAFIEYGSFYLGDTVGAIEEKNRETYGLYNGYSKETIGSFEWNHYFYKESMGDPDYYGDNYCYVGDNEVIYFYFQYPYDISISNLTERILNSVSIQGEIHTNNSNVQQENLNLKDEYSVEELSSILNDSLDMYSEETEKMTKEELSNIYVEDSGKMIQGYAEELASEIGIKQGDTIKVRGKFYGTVMDENGETIFYLNSFDDKYTYIYITTKEDISDLELDQVILVETTFYGDNTSIVRDGSFNMYVDGKILSK